MRHEASRDSWATCIRQQREAAGLNKADLARRIGVSDVTIGFWERGKIQTIQHDKLLRLAKALDVTVSELLGDPLLEGRDRRVAADAQETMTVHVTPETPLWYRLWDQIDELRGRTQERPPHGEDHEACVQ